MDAEYYLYDFANLGYVRVSQRLQPDSSSCDGVSNDDYGNTIIHVIIRCWTDYQNKTRGAYMRRLDR